MVVLLSGITLLDLYLLPFSSYVLLLSAATFANVDVLVSEIEESSVGVI